MKNLLKIVTVILIISLCINCKKDRITPCPNCPIILDFYPTKGAPGEIITVEAGNIPDSSFIQILVGDIPGIMLGQFEDGKVQFEIVDSMSTGLLSVIAENPNPYQDNLLTTTGGTLTIKLTCQDSTGIWGDNIGDTIHPLIKTEDNQIIAFHKDIIGGYSIRVYNLNEEHYDLSLSPMLFNGHNIQAACSTKEGSLILAGTKALTNTPFLCSIKIGDRNASPNYKEYDPIDLLADTTISPSEVIISQVLETKSGDLLVTGLIESDHLYSLKVNQNLTPLPWNTGQFNGKIISGSELINHGFEIHFGSSPYTITTSNHYHIISNNGVTLDISASTGAITNSHYNGLNNSFSIYTSAKKTGNNLLLAGSDGQIVESSLDGRFLRAVTQHPITEIRDIILDDQLGDRLIAVGTTLSSVNSTSDISFLQLGDSGTIIIDSSTISSQIFGLEGSFTAEHTVPTGNGGFLIAGKLTADGQTRVSFVRVDCTGRIE